MTDGVDPTESQESERGDLSEETDIQPLDEQTIAQIAAGEVVERPASVVKELVENALDADASRVEVVVENGGIDRIEVTDDGVGMTEADLRAAVREHTTSKLTDAAELERVDTLGFRGEALHTIGAISRLTITSRPRADRDGSDAGADGAADRAAATGARVRYEGGDLEAVEPAAHPEGTTVAVEDLFYNTPARRKYLAESTTEFRHVSKVVGRYALANPDVAVSLTHDDSTVFATTGDGDRQSAVMAVYGREVAESMLPVDSEPALETSDPDVAVERVVGLVSDPETTRASRDYLATYVNGRYVEADVLRSAIVDAYGGQLAADRYPFAVLFVDVPPERVDVNVHPRKLAVRFDDEAAVRDAVTDAVRDALLSAGMVRSSAPRGTSAPAETTIEPEALESDDEAGAADDAGSDGSGPESDAAGAESSASAATDAADTDATADAVDAATDAADTDATADADVPAAPEDRDSTDVTDEAASVADGLATADETIDRESDDGSPTASDRAAGPSAGGHAGHPTASDGDASFDASSTDDATGDTTEGNDSTTDSAGAGDDAVSHSSEGTDRRFDASEQRTLAGDASSIATDFDRLPSLRVLGQLHDTYVVAEDDDGLVLIDQHAADERVHFERLREAVETSTAQVLAEPVAFDLTPTEAETFDDYADAIERLGFHADRDDRTLSVRSVPAILGETLEPDAVRDVFDALLAGGDGARTVEAMADELLADLACAPAVTGNTSLTEGSVADLLAALDDCENPFECPHGRPTVVRIDADELDDRFERDYPGHGVRRD